MAKFSTLDEVRDKVHKEGGVLSLDVADLRDAVGQQKLGVHVRGRISNELAGLGLGHEPAELPEYQGNPVLVFKLGSKVARIVEAVRNPGSKSAAILRETVSEDAEATLDRIRELLDN
jgi:hypothetical protein